MEIYLIFDLFDTYLLPQVYECEREDTNCASCSKISPSCLSYRSQSILIYLTDSVLGEGE